MKTLLVVTSLLLMAANAQAQYEPACGDLGTVVEEDGFEVFWPSIEVPTADGTYELTFCLEMWDSAGGYLRMASEDGVLFYVVDGVLDQETGYYDEYEVRSAGDPELNPELYPNSSDINFYLADPDVLFVVWLSPYVEVHTRLTYVVTPE